MRVWCRLVRVFREIRLRLTPMVRARAPNLTGYYAVPVDCVGEPDGKRMEGAGCRRLTRRSTSACLGRSGGRRWRGDDEPDRAVGLLSANGFVYVFLGGKSCESIYNAPIVPMALSNLPVINVNGKSWLTFQHLLVNWFDQYGVYVQGTSDHLVFANMEADSMIPQGTQPLGFYVNESAPGPGDIKIYNSEAHLNYDGFRFDGSATAITLVNDTAYANRNGALVGLPERLNVGEGRGDGVDCQPVASYQSTSWLLL